MNNFSGNAGSQKHRDAMRKAGLGPVQIWMHDTQHPNCAAECRRQCLLAARADTADSALQRLLDDAPVEVDGWTS